MPRPESASIAWIPPDADLDELAEGARECHACPLYKRATQSVFGEGPTPATLMLVGEQPGDREDLAGRPFVGPAGRLLDELLEEADIPRERVYLTNAVKHFKWEPRGKRRLHARPNAMEVNACRGWLEAELRLVRPKVIVCLGAIAVQTFFGRALSVVRDRGAVRDGSPWAEEVVVTYHPSALVRMKRDYDEYLARREEVVTDLTLAAKAAGIRARVRRRASSRSRVSA